jgi:hypothetical protein
MGLVSMGAMVYMLKMKLAGREVDYSVDNLLREGIARSGVGGLMYEASSLFPGVRASSRFAGVNAQGFIGGASLTQAADAEKMLRFVPFNNLFYLRAIFNATGD